MPSLKDIREALADSLTVIPGVQVSAYYLDNPTPPSLHVVPGGSAGAIQYDEAMARGLDLWPFAIQAFVAMSIDRGGQQTLDLLMAPAGRYSVKAAVEADSTLGGVVADAHVVACSGYQRFQFDQVLLGSEWVVHVRATGEE